MRPSTVAPQLSLEVVYGTRDWLRKKRLFGTVPFCLRERKDACIVVAGMRPWRSEGKDRPREVDKQGASYLILSFDIVRPI